MSQTMMSPPPPSQLPPMLRRSPPGHGSACATVVATRVSKSATTIALSFISFDPCVTCERNSRLLNAADTTHAKDQAPKKRLCSAQVGIWADVDNFFTNEATSPPTPLHRRGEC